MITPNSSEYHKFFFDNLLNDTNNNNNVKPSFDRYQQTANTDNKNFNMEKLEHTQLHIFTITITYTQSHVYVTLYYANDIMHDHFLRRKKVFH